MKPGIVIERDIELMADALIDWVEHQTTLRLMVTAFDDDLRREGMLLYSDPGAMR